MSDDIAKLIAERDYWYHWQLAAIGLQLLGVTLMLAGRIMRRRDKRRTGRE